MVRAPLASGIVVLSLVFAGCSARLAPVASTPERSVEPQRSAAADPVEPRPAWRDRVEAPAPVDDEPIVVTELLPQTPPAEIAGEIVDDPLAPGERVTASPLDELASVDPDEAPEVEPLPAVEVEPTFDIPIVMNEQVRGWIDRYSRKYKGSFEAGLSRSGRYLERFREIFAEAGLPEDVVYMAHVESAYKTSAYSHAHARGIFQFIASTGRNYGLRVDYWIDERADPEKSARAAAAYMKDLYEEFGDWYLAFAAYNAGEGKVRRAISRTGSRDFWKLARTRHLRWETKNHVPAIIAATVLSKSPEKYGLTYAPDEPLEWDTIAVDGAVDMRVLARCAGTDQKTLQALNPALRRGQTAPDGTTDVHVPPGAGAMTLAALEEVPASERVLWVRHRVRRGESLSTIARRYGVSVRGIQESNGMGRRTLIRTGQELRVPTSSATRYASAALVADAGEIVKHRVRRGDTLSSIARRHGTTASAIAAVNGMGTHDLLRVGKTLTVVRGARTMAAARSVLAGDDVAVVASTNGKTHTVRRGDTLWRIASRYGTSVRRICSLNGITPNTVIHPGLRLTVR